MPDEFSPDLSLVLNRDTGPVKTDWRGNFDKLDTRSASIRSDLTALAPVKPDAGGKIPRAVVPTVIAQGSPVELPNGIRTAFSTPAPYVAGTLVVLLNGLREGFITETSGTAFAFSDPPLAADSISLIYQPST